MHLLYFLLCLHLVSINKVRPSEKENSFSSGWFRKEPRVHLLYFLLCLHLVSINKVRPSEKENSFSSVWFRKEPRVFTIICITSIFSIHKF